LAGQPLEAEIGGLDIMNNDPTHARVLYACVSSGRLQDFTDAIANAMSDAGFALQEKSVKLHMTLLNVKYAEGSIETMDVSRLLEKYGNFQFGRITIREVS
uniref:AKAP7_NLS domain-containing protein n=1 Tax=Gongylonema pulchrum TaxID=637853 RepID=A0A183DFQ4_9BILA